MEAFVPDNRIIAKNTFFLYVRLLISIVMSLYTIRLVLEAIGIEDYGIYNVTSSVIVMFSFVSGTMRITTQRFLSFELGRNNKEKLTDIFAQSIYSYLLIVFVIFILGETLGLWLLNNTVIIPSGRLFATNIAYQFSILSFIVMILGEPYNAAIIAKEKMRLFALGAILLSVLNLIAALLLKLANFDDNLIAYSILVFLCNLLLSAFYVVYCTRTFEFCKFTRNKIDVTTIKNMTLFAFWNMLGQITNLLRRQGINILIGMFFIPAINAARAISLKVYAVSMQFSNNLYTAVCPQIVKLYSSNNKESMLDLFYRSSRYSFFLVLVLVGPIFLELDWLLSMWLKDVPDYAVLFSRIIIVNSLVEALVTPIDQLMLAYGELKKYNIFVCTINVFNMPIAFYLYMKGFGPEYAMYVNLCLLVLTFIPRIIICRSAVGLKIQDYFSRVIIRLSIIILLFLGWVVVCYRYIFDNFSSLLLLLFHFIFIVFSIMFFGLSVKEREQVYGLIYSRLSALV